ncbi:hypothetical protein ABFA07_021272 [Porites harrisoni]
MSSAFPCKREETGSRKSVVENQILQALADQKKILTNPTDGIKVFVQGISGRLIQLQDFVTKNLKSG